VSGDITIGSGADVVVMSEALRLDLQKLKTSADDLLVQRARLIQLVGESETLAVTLLPASVGRSIQGMDEAAHAIATAEQGARSIDRAVVACLAGYENAEHQAGTVLHGLSQQLAWLAGASLHVTALPLALGALGAAPEIGLGLLIASKITGATPSQMGAGLGSFLETHPRIVSNPATVGVINEGVTNADAVGAGFIGMPTALAEDLGAGVPASSRVITGLGGVFGLLKETAVTVEQTSLTSSATDDKTGSGVSRTLAQRTTQFISADKQPNGEQVRIEKFSQPGRPDRFEVFVAGTVTFNPISKGEPFDMTSNMNGVGHVSPGAYRSVVEAMRQAGITPKSPIILNGYSQGGLIASLVASSNHYNVKGLVTFGSPSGQVPIAANIPTLTVRHTEDIVPALGGQEVNKHAVVVYRTLFDDRNPPTDLPVAGHDFGFYKQTAGIIDRSTNPELRAVLDPINHFEDGATTVTTTMYKAHRDQP
jgi:hypothetical protein